MEPDTNIPRRRRDPMRFVSRNHGAFWFSLDDVISAQDTDDDAVIVRFRDGTVHQIREITADGLASLIGWASDG